MNMELNNAIVNTPSGKLQGSFERSCLGDNYYAFKGIPYAKPPIGQLRFRDPQPLEPWTGIRDATSYGPIAAQYDDNLKRVIGSEDCLYLNVFTRNLNVKSRSPVMFWVHGAWYGDSGNDDYFGPDYLLAKDVVLVTVDFRVGVFGLLDLRDKAASGNQGLKDQVMALKWVQSHIINFGGDPDNVTIFGQSAGASAVHLLAMSQMTKGLFHKAILQSCTALSSLGMTRVPDESEMFEFLQRLDIHEKDAAAILESLRKISFEKLIEVQTQLTSGQKIIQGTRLFSPTIDDKSEEPFMPISSIEATEKGLIQVPLMVGYNEMESLFFLEYGLDLNDVDQHLERYTPLRIDHILRENNLTLAELRYLYFKDEAITEKNLSKLVKYWTDLVFVENAHRLVKIQTHCSSAPTYLYKFTYHKNPTLFNVDTAIKGANHGDELVYLFKMKLCDAANMEQLQKGTGADRVMKQMVELWTNFAKTGKPTLDKSDLLPLHWLPVTDKTVLRYLNIGEDLRMEKELNIEQFYLYKKNSS